MLNHILRRPINQLRLRQSIRSFATAAAAPPQAADQTSRHVDLDLRFHHNNAQLKINLPSNGPTWFFITNKTNAKEFIDMCRDEDKRIDGISMYSLVGEGATREKAFIKEDDVLFDQFVESDSAIFVEINGINYKFPEFPNTTLERLT